MNAVLYLHWLVPIAQVASLTPEGTRLFERNGMTILTGLSYRHGHFGPTFLGPLRKLLPSPRQSNWRLYLEPGGELGLPEATVMFLRNFLDSRLHQVAAKAMSDVLRADYAPGFTFDAERDEIDHSLTSDLPILQFKGTVSSSHALPPGYDLLFKDWRHACQSLLLQDAAVSPTLDGRIALSTIDLPISLDTVVPLTTTYFSAGPWLTRLVGRNRPWAMLVPSVPFAVTGERLLKC